MSEASETDYKILDSLIKTIAIDGKKEFMAMQQYYNYMRYLRIHGISVKQEYMLRFDDFAIALKERKKKLGLEGLI